MKRRKLEAEKENRISTPDKFQKEKNASGFMLGSRHHFKKKRQGRGSSLVEAIQNQGSKMLLLKSN